MTLARRHGELRGRVQGVGMRPCVAELARALELAGQVRNDAGGVVIEIEGPLARLDRFVERLTAEAPAAARIEEARW